MVLTTTLSEPEDSREYSTGHRKGGAIKELINTLINNYWMRSEMVTSRRLMTI